MTDTPAPRAAVDEDTLLRRLRMAQVASCSCDTKSPELDLHHPMCRYRLFAEAEAFVARHLPPAPAAQSAMREALEKARSAIIDFGDMVDMADLLNEIDDVLATTPEEGWRDIATAPKDGSRFLAECEIDAEEFDESDRKIGRIVERYAVVAYFCFGAFVHFPFNGGIPTNIRYLRWQPLPDVSAALEAAP